MNTTDVRTIPPGRSTEIDIYNLERMAYAMHLTIDLPPATGGWARLTTERGAQYHAWVGAVKA